MDRTLVLLGKTGTGKSTTGNIILGREAFKSGSGFSSVTQTCQLESSTINGRTVNVIDTPGLFDPEIPNASIVKEITNCIKLAKDGLHGVLLVISLKSRYTPEEAQVIDILQILFGPRIINYMVVVFTHGDLLKKEKMTIEQYIEKRFPTGLKDFLRRCDNRRAVIYKKDREKQKAEVKILLSHIEKIIEKEGIPYTDEMFQAFNNLAALIGQKGQGCSDPIATMTEAFTRVTVMVQERLEKSIKNLEEQLAIERGKRMEAQSEFEKLKNKLKDNGHRCTIQ